MGIGIGVEGMMLSGGRWMDVCMDGWTGDCWVECGGEYGDGGFDMKWFWLGWGIGQRGIRILAGW